ncbi:MAG: cyclic nucleotide-binding domain-containing protein [Magnetococcales bacterium]|nr:cyclic nucleotide-binding domain-containing protein [Magnetococcales bacterium]
MSVLLKLMDQVPFFWQFTADEKEVFVENDSFFESYQDGAFIIDEGSTDSSLCVLVRGDVKVTKKPHINHALTTMQAGAMFGEISFLTGQERTSNVIAKGPVTVFKIDRQSMQQLSLSVQNKIKDQLIEVLVSRLEKMNEKVMKSF